MEPPPCLLAIPILRLLLFVTYPPPALSQRVDDSELDSIVIANYPIIRTNLPSGDPTEAGININCTASNNNNNNNNISSSRQSRLLGGVNAKIDDFPYIVALTLAHDDIGDNMSVVVICTGSLISDQWVLISAFSSTLATFLGFFSSTLGVESVGLDGLDVIIGGDPNISNRSTARQTRKVSMFIHHRGFSEGPEAKSKRLDNNIALIRLDKPVQFGANVRPVCLSEREPVVGEHGVLPGWGSPEPRRLLLLQNVTLPLISNEECTKLLNGTEDADELTENMFCAGGKDLGMGPCLEEFGGPLVSVEHPGFQIGVVSWTTGQESCGEPAFYTRVDKYFNWIVTNVNKYSM